MKLFKFKQDPIIEFACAEKDWDVIPKPFPARKLIPDWYKALPMKTSTDVGSGTIKRCPPFLDAMQTGWILPLAGDVHFKVNSTASGLNYNWTFYKPLVENHGMNQVHTAKSPNPYHPRPPIKFLNYWMVKVPPGWSVLFTPPLNRVDPRFTCLSGIVECDKYFEYINFPFFFNIPDFDGVIEAGTPLVQVIPFKRDTTFFKDSVIRQMTKEEEFMEHPKTKRKVNAHPSHYRDTLWEKK